MGVAVNETPYQVNLKGIMQIKIIQDSAARFLKDNATTVLTAGGVVGTVATGVLAFRAGFKTSQILRDEEHRIHDESLRVEDGGGLVESLSTTSKVKLVWPYFIPPVATGTATIAAIIMADRMSAKRAAALAAAYGVAQGQFEEYKDKMAEKLGVNKTEKAKTEMAQERANSTPGSGAIVIYGDEILCFDEPTGRYFKSTVEKIRRAVNSTNQEILKHGFADASHFYSELELPGTRWSDDVGWTQPFELSENMIMADEKPCFSIDFKQYPILDYVRGGDRYS